MPGKDVQLDKPVLEEHSADNSVYMNVSQNHDTYELGLRARLASVSVGGPGALWCPNTGKKQFDSAHANLPDKDATPEDYDKEDIYLQFEEIYHSVSDLNAPCVIAGNFTRILHGVFQLLKSWFS